MAGKPRAGRSVSPARTQGVSVPGAGRAIHNGHAVDGLGLSHPVQAFGKLTHPPSEPVRRCAGLLMRLPGCVALPPRFGAFLASRVEGPLRSVELVAGGIEHAFG